MSTKIEKDEIVLQVREEAPAAYSDEFLNVMSEYAYDALRSHLLRQNVGLEALRMLDDLYVLMSIQKMMVKSETIRPFWNDEAGECIAHISRGVVMLGGYFIGPSMSPTKTREGTRAWEG